MPATNPRVNVVLDEPVYQGLRRWAKRDGVSLSLKVRDLVKDALDVEEDRALGRLGDIRPEEGQDPCADMGGVPETTEALTGC